MRFFGFTTATLLLACSYTGAAQAADQNGYTAQYECRAGSAHCNVDVAALSRRACNQTIAPSAPWSSINWSNSTICIEAGDHTWKGTLTIPSNASGSSGNYKVLRYTGSDDATDASPWNQQNRARLQRIAVDGADFWLIDRLTLPTTTGSQEDRIFVSAVSQGTSGDVRNMIFNRLLIEGSGNSGVPYSGFRMNCDYTLNFNSITLQNSVIRSFHGAPNTAPLAVSLQCGDNIRAVNNEIYDWSEHVLQAGHNGAPTMRGLVIENNDFYFTPAIYSPDGRAKGENLVALKLSGTADSPARVIQNRFWGARDTDTGACCIGGGGGGGLIVNGRTDGGNRYILIQNNTLFDSQHGLSWINGNNQQGSIIGNLIYDIRVHYSPTWWSHAMNLEDVSNAEVYLNTIVNASTFTISGIYNDGNDIRCNAIINSGRREDGGNPPGGSQADHNAFYGSSLISFNASNTNVQRGMDMRTGNRGYNAGDVVRFADASQCTLNNTAGCFLYKATQAGTSDPSSTPSACTDLGCSFNDGSVIWQAVRGPHYFWRKLRTTPERMIVPYAKPHVTAQEAYSCPQNFASRQGIGIDNSL